MTLQFSKKLWMITIGLILLIGLAFGSFYFNKLKPMNQEIEQLSKNIDAEEKTLATYEKKPPQSQKEVAQDSTELQKKVPVKPLVEQFLLDLEKAEVLSNSFISSMSFGEADVTVDPQAKAEDGQTLEQKVEGAGQIDEAKQVQNGKDATPEEKPLQDVTTPPPSSLPPGMKRLTVNLTVDSPDYYAMETFLKSIEDLERITKIDTLTFTGKQERTAVETEETPKLTYSLAISTFYHPGLKELQDELPPFETPEPGNKKNPLAQAGVSNEPASGESKVINGQVAMITQQPDKKDKEKSKNTKQSKQPKKTSQSEQPSQTQAQPQTSQISQTLSETQTKQTNQSSKQSTTNEKPNDEQKTQPTTDSSEVTATGNVIKHTVKKGETLYSISKQYYNHGKGVETIKKWNKLPNYNVNVGEVIEVPIEK